MKDNLASPGLIEAMNLIGQIDDSFLKHACVRIGYDRDVEVTLYTELLAVTYSTAGVFGSIYDPEFKCLISDLKRMRKEDTNESA